ncbi:MAG: hypothetical protein K5860_03330 [Bacteroidales bacterium]|nr:hypothetical protein [Bacteroidales bacterium]
MTNEERIDIVTYRLENAKTTLAEVQSHIANGFEFVSQITVLVEKWLNENKK